MRLFLLGMALGAMLFSLSFYSRYPEGSVDHPERPSASDYHDQEMERIQEQMGKEVPKDAAPDESEHAAKKKLDLILDLAGQLSD